MPGVTEPIAGGPSAPGPVTWIVYMRFATPSPEVTLTLMVEVVPVGKSI